MSADLDRNAMLRAVLDMGHYPLAYEYDGEADVVHVYCLPAKKDPELWLRKDEA